MKSEGFNPYAPPQADITVVPSAPGLDYFEENGCLVVRGGSVLPPLCVRTGELTVGNLKTRTVRQIPAWTIWAFVLVSPIVGAILMLIMQKKFKVAMAISDAARRRRRNVMVLGVLISAGAFLGLIAAARFGIRLSPITIFFGIMMVWVGLAVALVGGRPYKILKSAGNYVYLQLHAEALYEFERYKQQHAPAPAPVMAAASGRAGYPF